MFTKRHEMNYINPNTKTIGLDFTFNKFNGMPYRILGNSGLRVSNVGLGTWKFGIPETGDNARVNKKTGIRILDKAFEEGVTFWDTANRYNNSSGNSERVIGSWIKENSGLRNSVVVATKLFGASDGTTPNHCRLSRTNILESTYASLERLQTDYIDLMFFHSFEDETPVEESLMAIEDLISHDLIRYFGVSNYCVNNLKVYSKYFNKFIRARVQAVENRYDILYKENKEDKGVLDYCKENNISFIPWSPLRRGLLTERYINKDKASSGDRLFDERILDRELIPSISEKIRELTEIGRKYNMSLSNQTIAYMLTIPAMGPIIVASSTVEQVQTNAGAGKITLSKEQITEIEKVI
ncbi:MAG: aldo/keto reductase [Ignavibacteria bacterium]|jgi:aryl-alcohol dehydrogenase-like predicted oxidoreductase